LTGKDVTLEGRYDELAAAFQALVDNYIAKKYPARLLRFRVSTGFRPDVFAAKQTCTPFLRPLETNARCSSDAYRILQDDHFACGCAVRIRGRPTQTENTFTRPEPSG